MGLPWNSGSQEMMSAAKLKPAASPRKQKQIHPHPGTRHPQVGVDLLGQCSGASLNPVGTIISHHTCHRQAEFSTAPMAILFLLWRAPIIESWEQLTIGPSC